MHLFLCGGSSGENVKGAYKTCGEIIDKKKKVLYVPLAMNFEDYGKAYKWFSKEILYFGLSEFEMVNSSKELSDKNFSDYSFIFIGGGNTYKLLNEIYTNDNLEKILNYLNNNGIIFAGSAGASIFGKDIDCCKIMDEKKTNYINNKGLNICNGYSILCHFNKKIFANNKAFLEEYSKQNNIIFLPENDTLYISNNDIGIIGEEDYLIIKKGVSYIFNTSSGIVL